MCPVVTCHVTQAHVSKQKFNRVQTKLGSKTSPVNDMTHLQSQLHSTDRAAAAARLLCIWCLNLTI